MHTRHPLRSALFAMLVPVVAIAVFGNSWFTEHVRFDNDYGPLATRFVNTAAPFVWTFTPRRGGDPSTTLWFAQWLAIGVVVLGTFLITWAVARHATGASLFLGAWGTTVLVAMVANMVGVFVAYGVIFGDSNVDGLGRFWHAVFAGPDVALWGAGVGFFVGLVAMALVGGVDRTPDYALSGPIPGAAPVWQQTEPTPTPVPAYQSPPSPWADQTYVAPAVVAPPPTPTAAPPVVTPPPPPQRPAGDPTVTMVQPPDPPTA